MNAIKTNPACKALYERLRANGKTGKQGLIAVCNKLLKQVFIVVKNNSLYQTIIVQLILKKGRFYLVFLQFMLVAVFYLNNCLSFI
mgnify:FL=1